MKNKFHEAICAESMSKNMNILGISGTPRRGGNSEILLNAALEPFVAAGWYTTRILLSETKIEPCTGCETCVEEKICVIKDAMQDVYKAFEACDAIIIAAPSYWRNVPAQLKALFDRTFAAKNRPLKGKLGGAIAVGRATAGGGQSKVLDVIHNFYLSNGALCVSGELNGVTASADKPGDILAQPRRLEQANILGRNILDLLRNCEILPLRKILHTAASSPPCVPQGYAASSIPCTAQNFLANSVSPNF